ncbi:DUF2384 domain-containing protein [Flavobacterium sp. ZT3R18]|uniref:MbcA/ParS/Xre antitoxin family protein n=1 Tax=Flavobacterium sp. ZT3R18 TaxID=2594429 RepID=UPI00117A273A|nr:MbcA/ParS/Xre antitoxin family protein [Flavobacterium sp. ZT3R18]TRX34975.1 DUF2384 domain-containing protein [Flavobacterium sp. ZT3R18]
MESEKLIIKALDALYVHAESLFDSKGDFDIWLDTPNFFTDKHPPRELLDTLEGIKFINDRLTDMEYGDNV